MKGASCLPSGPPPRVYDVGWPADTPYRPHTHKAGYHYGQRKLLMSEIEFLTLYGDRAARVIYVGAAPGLHLRVLVDCFPLHTFHLFDPCPFHPRLQDPHWTGSRRMQLRNEAFTDAHAEAYARDGVPTLFISDVRHKLEHEQYPSEECVWEDMAAQRRWLEILQSAAAILKFRLPWCDDSAESRSDATRQVEYLDGELRLPVWGCPSTTETRLILSPPYATKVWDCRVYERHMFYFNTVVRARPFDGGTYDEAAESEILRLYVQRCAPRQKVPVLRQRILKELLTTQDRRFH